jgi:hypothetical protein
MNSAKAPTRHVKVAGDRGTRRDADRIEIPSQVGYADVSADVEPCAEGYTLRVELRESPVERPFLQLEVRNPEAKQTARLGTALEHGDVMPGATKLLRGGEAGRARSNDRDAKAALPPRRTRHHPSLRERPIGNGLFDGSNGHGLLDER